MRVTPAQLLPLMLLLVCLFGCKAGQVLKVVGAVAITTVRVAALAAAASGSHHHRVEGGTPGPATPESEAAQRRVEEHTNRPGQCTELFVATVPPTPEGSAPPRAAECGGNVLIQDENGRWHHYGNDAAPAIQEP